MEKRQLAETGAATDDFDRLFATAAPDAERALDAVHDAHNMPLDEEPKRIIDDLKAVR